jgi:uncharacterized membrane protein YphA (DoxX/SURF4 family)
MPRHLTGGDPWGGADELADDFRRSTGLLLAPRKSAGEVAGGMKSEIVAMIFRVSLGFWFTFNGGVKLFASGLDRFTRDISNYRLVSPPYDAIAAYTVPWFEVVAGICLMLGILRAGSILVLGGLVGIFAVCIGWAWFHQLEISCGCRAGDAPIHYWGKALEFCGYFAVLGWLWRRERVGRACGNLEKA